MQNGQSKRAGAAGTMDLATLLVDRASVNEQKAFFRWRLTFLPFDRGHVSQVMSGRTGGCFAFTKSGSFSLTVTLDEACKSPRSQIPLPRISVRRVVAQCVRWPSLKTTVHLRIALIMLENGVVSTFSYRCTIMS